MAATLTTNIQPLIRQENRHYDPAKQNYSHLAPIVRTSDKVQSVCENLAGNMPLGFHGEVCRRYWLLHVGSTLLQNNSFTRENHDR